MKIPIHFHILLQLSHLFLCSTVKFSFLFNNFQTPVVWGRPRSLKLLIVLRLLRLQVLGRQFSRADCCLFCMRNWRCYHWYNPEISSDRQTDSRLTYNTVNFRCFFLTKWYHIVFHWLYLNFFVFQFYSGTGTGSGSAYYEIPSLSTISISFSPDRSSCSSCQLQLWYVDLIRM